MLEAVSLERFSLERFAGRIDARLNEIFAAERARAVAISPEAHELVNAMAELTMRGGKRLRPLALYAGYCAARGQDAELERALDAGAALELLQSYFLIQDDWMDGDEQRRGGPSVHVALGRARNSEQLGASLAILASDLASGAAWELIAHTAFPPARLREALAAFGQMHFEVVCGQQLDLLAHSDVALVHRLKTGSYSVRGPLRLGALLGDASDEQLEALQRFGEPLGAAFQLRDDLLGVFGGAATGKPVGNDLRAGKRTALIAEAQATLSPERLRVLHGVLGRAQATDAEVAAATAMLIESGARDRLEARARNLLATAIAALRSSPLAPEGIALLTSLAERVVLRSH